MSAPQWLADLLAEHRFAHLGEINGEVFSWCRCSFVGDLLDFDSHVAAVLWAEFTARAQQAREDVAGESIRTGSSPTWDLALYRADAAIAALLRAMGGGL